MARSDDRSTLGGRLQRYAQVGGTAAGLAARFAAARVSGGFDPKARASDLREALGGLKGPVMKMAQILATVPGAVPEEYAAELAKLQANAPPMGWPFVRRRMAGELGADWQARFAEFSHEAIHAASLGQVHKARLPDGRPVAVKLQYPGMASAVDADLDQLDIALKAFRAVDRSVDLGEIKLELGARLREELDYALEAKHMALFAHMLADYPGVSVPRAVAELSTSRLLTMDWLEGRPLMAFKDADQDTRNTLAVNLFHAWYVPVHVWGVVHGDPHLGNYAARPDLGLNLLDFGAIRVLPPRFVHGVVELYRGLLTGDEDRTAAAYELWGFKGLTRELIDVLNIWARFLYRPLLTDSADSIDEGTMGADEGRVTMQRVHAEVRRLGTVTIPPEFLFLDRSAIGLGGVFLRLRARVNWHRLFEALIDGFSEDALAARQAAALASAGLSAGGGHA
jgi:predicted unusual protein kinase regulating ubiquinone biosynthesis (AarF/ABC1/UbiB family)